jgi:hypothetical protein
MKTSSKLSLALAVVMLCQPGAANAVSVSWGSWVPANLIDSQGNSLDGSYQFEIGTFTAGFTPDANNMADWSTNFTVFDRTYAANGGPSDPNGDWDVSVPLFTGISEIDAGGHSLSPDANPSSVFTPGDQIYLWVYNQKTLTPGAEWALVTRAPSGGSGNPNEWIIPDPANPDPFHTQQLALTDELNPANQADTAIFGGVNNVQGPGEYNTGSTPSTFHLQTHVVPEPAAGLLIGALGLASVLRRKR